MEEERIWFHFSDHLGSKYKTLLECFVSRKVFESLFLDTRIIDDIGTCENILYAFVFTVSCAKVDIWNLKFERCYIGNLYSRIGTKEGRKRVDGSSISEVTDECD